MRHTAAVLATPPSEEPLSLFEAKQHLKVDIPEDDDVIRMKLSAAVGDAEDYTGRRFVTQSWNVYWDRWPCWGGFFVPFGKLQSVDSLEYRDSAGTTVVMVAGADYIVDDKLEPGIILLPTGKSWPSVELYPASPIRARITCGYGVAADVPAKIKAAILLQLSHLYEHRESVTLGNSVAVESKDLAMGFTHLLSAYKLWAF